MSTAGPQADTPVTLEQEDVRRARVAAVRVALVYLVATAVYIAVSDYLTNYFVSVSVDASLPPQIRQERIESRVLVVSTVKGWIFALVTAALLFLLVRRYITTLLAAQARARTELARSEAEYRLLFAANPLPMWAFLVDDLRLSAVNEMTVRTFGYSRAEFERMNVIDLVVAADRDALRALIAATRNAVPGAAAPVVRTWRVVRKDGSEFDMECTGHPVVLDGRKGRLVVGVDVTERLKTQRALEQYRHELEARVEERTQALSTSNQQLQGEIRIREAIEGQLRIAKAAAENASANKTAFLARTTHEIRLPLTSILGYAELLLGDGADVGTARSAEVIRQNARRLLHLIEDLLDLSRIESGQLAVRPAPVAVRSLLGEIDDLFRRQLESRGLSLQTLIEHDVPTQIVTDPARLRQILVNLVGNAAKFTAAGGIAVRVRPAGGNAIAFAVADTGPGIAPERLSQIFTPFYQSPEPQAGPRGAGLGLAISRQLAEKLGGSLEAASTPGQGANFVATIRTDLAATPPDDPPVQPPTVQASRLSGTILVAEDDAHIRWLLARVLENAGARVTTVTDGAAAVAALRECDGNPPSLILLDMHMPGVGGPEAARAMRAGGYAGPIVGLTASPAEEDRDALLAAGCNAIALKPIDRATFVPMLHGLMAADAAVRG